MEETKLARHLIQDMPVHTGQLKVNNELAGPGELLSQAWEMTKSRFWVLVGGVLIPTVLITLIMVFLILPMLFAGLGAGLLGTRIADNLTPAVLIGFGLGFLGIVLVGLWQGITIIELIAGSEEKPGLWATMKKALPKIPGFFGISLISGFITAGAAFPLLVPAIIVSVWFAFGQFVYVTEGIRGLTALRISREYVRGRFWAVFGRQMVIVIIVAVWVIANSVLEGVLGEDVFGRIEGLISLVSIPLWILIPVYQFVIFKNLRDMRGKIDPADVEQGKTKWTLLAIWGILGWLLIPMAAIGLLIFAINPTAKLQQARDAQERWDQEKQLQRQEEELIYPQINDI